MTRAEFPRGNAADELDAVVQDIQRHVRAGDASRWQVAELLLQIWTDGLWKTREAADGAPRYESWTQCIETETGLAKSHACRLLAAASFGRDAFERYGLRKLYAISSADQEHHDALLAECARGATATEIEKRAKDCRSEASDDGRPPKAATTGPLVVALVDGIADVSLVELRRLADPASGRVRLVVSGSLVMFCAPEDLDVQEAAE